MSQSNSAAIRRRVNLPATQAGAGAGAGSMQAQQGNQPVQTSNGPGFTLPQVIAVVDKRLTNLETFMKDMKANGQVNNQRAKQNVSFSLDDDGTVTDTSAPSVPYVPYVPSDAFNDMVSEFNNRFEILAVELASLKDTIIKLQTYTMDVNKTLMEERVHVFSDLGNTTINTSDAATIPYTPYVNGDNDTSSVDLKDLVNAELGSTM